MLKKGKKKSHIYSVFQKKTLSLQSDLDVLRTEILVINKFKGQKFLQCQLFNS